MKKNEIVGVHSRIGLTAALVAIAGLVLACGSSSPSESEGRKSLEDNLAKHQYFKVKSFAKTNGMGDEKHYTLDFDAELECLLPIPALGCGKGAGQIIRRSGKIQFEKTENGWRAVTVEGV